MCVSNESWVGSFVAHAVGWVSLSPHSPCLPYVHDNVRRTGCMYVRKKCIEVYATEPSYAHVVGRADFGEKFGLARTRAVPPVFSALLLTDMASRVSRPVQAVPHATHRREWEREHQDAPPPVGIEKNSAQQNSGSGSVVPVMDIALSSIRSYGIYDEVIRQEQKMMTSAGVSTLSTPTPLHPVDGGTTVKQQGGPQTSVTKQLHGMLEEMMEEVFVEGKGKGKGEGKMEVAKALDMDGEFTIPAMPSPTRKEKNETETEKVVLELEAMSPLLREMREIEGVKCDVDVEAGAAGAVEIGPQEVKKEGDEEGAKRVPSLVRYFQDLKDATGRGGGGSGVGAGVTATAVNTVNTVKAQVKKTRSKPPLLPTHQGSSSSSSFIGQSVEFLEVLGLRETFDHVLSMASRATQGRRKMLAMIALSYLVLLHVFLISGRL